MVDSYVLNFFVNKTIDLVEIKLIYIRGDYIFKTGFSPI